MLVIGVQQSMKVQAADQVHQGNPGDPDTKIKAL
jgi:hypothetical protein